MEGLPFIQTPNLSSIPPVTKTIVFNPSRVDIFCFGCPHRHCSLVLAVHQSHCSDQLSEAEEEAFVHQVVVCINPSRKGTDRDIFKTISSPPNEYSTSKLYYYLQNIAYSTIWQNHWHHMHPRRHWSPTIYHRLFTHDNRSAKTRYMGHKQVRTKGENK